jgi:ubiquinone/menaquinone biosynthesis C-methylase UbiE
MQTVSLQDSIRAAGSQKSVDSYFQSKAAYWKNIYQQKSDHAAYIQLRRDVVLALVDKLTLSPESRILEVGCGAGVTTVALAQRGYGVAALDSVDAMIRLTRQLAVETGVEHRVRASLGDAHRLPFADNAFDLLLAIGVTPWVPSLDQSLREMVRVLAPGGYFIVTADNRWYVDLMLNPRWLAGTLLRRFGLLKPLDRPPKREFSTREFDALLSPVGLSKLEGKTVGFNFSLLPKASRRIARQKVQRLADRGAPLIRSAGANYIVVARKAVP